MKTSQAKSVLRKIRSRQQCFNFTQRGRNGTGRCLMDCGNEVLAAVCQRNFSSLAPGALFRRLRHYASIKRCSYQLNSQLLSKYVRGICTSLFFLRRIRSHEFPYNFSTVIEVDLSWWMKPTELLANTNLFRSWIGSTRLIIRLCETRLPIPTCQSSLLPGSVRNKF